MALENLTTEQLEKELADVQNIGPTIQQIAQDYVDANNAETLTGICEQLYIYFNFHLGLLYTYLEDRLKYELGQIEEEPTLAPEIRDQAESAMKKMDNTPSPWPDVSRYGIASAVDEWPCCGGPDNPQWSGQDTKGGDPCAEAP